MLCIIIATRKLVLELVATIISTMIVLAGSSGYVSSQFMFMQFMFYVHVYTIIAKVLRMLVNLQYLSY